MLLSIRFSREVFLLPFPTVIFQNVYREQGWHAWTRSDQRLKISSRYHPSNYRRGAHQPHCHFDNARIFDVFHSILPLRPHSPHHIAVCYKQRGMPGCFGSRAFCVTWGIYPHQALRDAISCYTRVIIPPDPLDVCWRWGCLRHHRSLPNDWAMIAHIYT